MPEFDIIIARKIFSRFFFGGGARAPLPPVSYVYAVERKLDSVVQPSLMAASCVM